MRFIVYLVLFFVLLPFTGRGSPHDTDLFEAPKLFEGRLIGGFNFTQVDGDTYAGYHKVGLNAGGMVYVHFNSFLGVSLEFLYTQKGSRGGTVKESYAWGTYIDKYYLNLNYVEMALMLHGDTYIFNYEAGLSYARLVKSKEWAESDVPAVFNPVLCRFNEEDFNYVVGLSYRINKRWKVNLRYQYSVMPIRPPERVLPRYNDGNSQHNNAVTLRLLYTL